MEYKQRKETPLSDEANLINSVQDKAFYPKECLPPIPCLPLSQSDSFPFQVCYKYHITPHLQGCNGYQDGEGSSETAECTHGGGGKTGLEATKGITVMCGREHR